MRISLGYPERNAERLLLGGPDRRSLVATLPAVVSAEQWEGLQRDVRQIHTSDALLDYVQDLILATRSGEWFVRGLSPRAGIAVVRAAQAKALMRGRGYVAPDDVQDILVASTAHRLVPVGGASLGARAQVQALVKATPLP